MSKSLSSKKILCKKLLSQKSSSRKSSSKNLSYQTNISFDDKKTNPIYNFIFTIILNSIIIYYLINLEDVSCNCIIDWRHNYIKYFSIFMILINTLIFIGVQIPYRPMNKNIIGFISMGFVILSLVNMYSLYTYVGDLNDTKCVCAVDKQKDINIFLYYYRYVFIIMPIILIVGVILLSFTLR